MDKFNLYKYIKSHPFWTIFFVLLLSTIFSDDKNTQSTTDKSDIAGDGLTRAQWESRCQRYTSVRSECAVAASVAQCIEIKLGVVESGMAQIYCNGSTPNFSLMGMK